MSYYTDYIPTFTYVVGSESKTIIFPFFSYVPEDTITSNGMSLYSYKASPDLLQNPLDVTTLSPIDPNYFSFSAMQHSLSIKIGVYPYADKFIFVLCDSLQVWSDVVPFTTFIVQMVPATKFEIKKHTAIFCDSFALRCHPLELH